MIIILLLHIHIVVFDKGVPMNAENHIWVSVCVVMTSTLDNNFEQLHIKPVHCNIETTTVEVNKNHLSKVYILHPSINLAVTAILFGCFQLDIMDPFF